MDDAICIAGLLAYTNSIANNYHGRYFAGESSCGAAADNAVAQPAFAMLYEEEALSSCGVRDTTAVRRFLEDARMVPGNEPGMKLT